MKIFKIATLALALTATTAFAADYDYIQGSAGYRDTVSHSGWHGAVDASKSLTKHVYGVAGYQHEFNKDYANAAYVGLGARNIIFNNPATDIYGQVKLGAPTSSIRNNDLGAAWRDVKRDYGVEVEAGLRHDLTKSTEIKGGLVATNMRNFLQDDLKWYGVAGVQQKLFGNVSAGVDVRAGKDDIQSGLNVRYSW